MSTEKNYIVAIEIGSSKITGLAGRKEPDGALHVVAAIQKPSADFIRKGRINNQLKTRDCIQDIKQRIERTLKKNVQKVYVGVGGMGMHAQANTVVQSFAEKTLITPDIVEQMHEENAQKHPADKVILTTVPQEYKLGAQLTLDPVGMQSDSIEAHFLNVVIRKDVCDDIEKCFRDAKMALAGVPITFLTLADNLLEEQKRRSGCVFVDMGAETTSVAIFKNNIIQHVAVIPLGGENITRDISSLQVDMTESERLKIKYGSALVPENAENHEDIALPMGNRVSFADFCELVEARQEEIIRNVAEQIKISNLDKDKLIGGIVLTGGASQMKDVDKAFAQITGFDREKISFINSIKTPLRTPSSLNDFNSDGSYNSAIALLESGEEICCGGEYGTGPDIFEEKENPDEKLLASIKERIANIEQQLATPVKKPRPIAESIDELEEFVGSNGKGKDFVLEIQRLRDLLESQTIQKTKHSKNIFKKLSDIWNRIEDTINEDD
ncbi:MAG: cell division protein FtsA [Alloprevotella sp.]|nr:cell division protein FtsA [Alloprevotella sp.]